MTRQRKLATGAAVAALFVGGTGIALLGSGDSPSSGTAATCDPVVLIEQAKSELLLTTKPGTWWAKNLGTTGHWANAWNLLAQAEQCAQTTTTTATVPTTTTLPTLPTTTGTAGSVLWRGDAEAGDFSQWNGTCEVQASRVTGSCYTTADVGDGDIQFVGAPVHGTNSTRATRHTIYTQLASTNTIRADLYTTHTRTGAAEGAEAYWHFAVYLPATNPDGSSNKTWAPQYNWNTLGDTHPDNDNDTYAIEFGIRDINTDHVIYAQHHDVNGGLGDNADWTPVAPLVYDQWIDVVFYVKWSTSPSVGHVTVWTNVNGAGYQQKYDHSYRTFAPGDPPYWKQALYTGGSRSWTNTAVFDGACRGTSFAAVAAC